ncbi:hypothetical protein OS493_026209 [Desmophyllum pertusum]|uniref:Uncharacterized protein n=1 Tax=Desmophyllum pertusum TaxID=174260 RepID=A0A9W9ZPN6_9CNID|nr:hypothetical protein OS493_026209 [Desmophyllum pertusum]
MNAERCYDEFYLVWESSCRNFIEDVKFASSVAAKSSRLKLHVFLRKDTPVKALPPKDNWIESHFSLTTSPYASDTGLIAHLLGKYGDFADLDNDEISQTRVYLVAEREDKKKKRGWFNADAADKNELQRRPELAHTRMFPGT